MFINTFNVFFPHAIIVLSCKFPMLQLSFLYNIRCNSLPQPQQIVLSTPLSIRRGVGGEAVEGLGVRLFFFFSLPIQFILLTFAVVKQLAMTYQVNEVLQRIIRFFASFCTLSLVNPNNLLTHTHIRT